MDDKYYKYVEQLRRDHGIHAAKRMAKDRRIEELFDELDFDDDENPVFIRESLKNIVTILKLMHRDN